MTHLDYRKQLKVSDFTKYMNCGPIRGTITYDSGSVIGYDSHLNIQRPYVENSV